jgi:hypothetical protein
MEDPTDTLSNWCADLVSLRRLEPGMVRLLSDTAPGVWVPVRDLYATAGVDGPTGDLPAASWLPGPGGDAGVAVIVFSDPDEGWSMTADYNAARLLGHAAPAAAG